MKLTKFVKLLLVCAPCLLISACTGDSETNNTAETEEQKVVLVCEAENGSFNGNVHAGSSKSGFSGEGYAEGFEEDGDSASITIDIEEDGFYDLTFSSMGFGGYKENYVDVDDERIGCFPSEGDAFTDASLSRIFLTKGQHVVKVSKYWGYIALDKLTVMTSKELPADYFEYSAKLSNPNASDNAKRVMSFLADEYGKHFLSGQNCDGGLYGHENACLWKATGKFPAVLGLDMIEYSPSRAENGSVGRSIDYAKEAWEAGAIVTMCWHWNAPSKYLTGVWYSGFYQEHTNIDLDKIMNGEDEEGYNLLISDMDAIAAELTKLKDEDVPILWRPLHEASGGWFWWGHCKSESYIKLYRLMYDKFVNEYELNNLIWLWNGQDPEWYPGDDVVDLVGTDIYPGEKVYTSQFSTYDETRNSAGGKKMVVLSENGCLFDPELAKRDGAMWGFWCTWGGEFVTNSKTYNTLSEQYTEEYMVKKVYEDENVLTLDELPDLEAYPIREE